MLLKNYVIAKEILAVVQINGLDICYSIHKINLNESHDDLKFKFFTDKFFVKY